MEWELKNNKNAAQTAIKMCSGFGESVMTDHQDGNWFSKFCSGHTSLRVGSRTGSSSELNLDVLRELEECNKIKVLEN